MSADVVTVVASVVGSGATAAAITARAHRRGQFREPMLTVASDFAATTMKVLAALRRVKPTKGTRPHRNEALLSDRELRAMRYDELQQCFDELRGLRGRVRLHFPGVASDRSDVTVLADDVIGALRVSSDAAEKFWQRCDDDPAKRREFEDRFNADYRRERGPSRRDRLVHRLGNRRAESAASGAGSSGHGSVPPSV